MVALGKDQGELSMTELCLIAVLGPLSFCMNVLPLFTITFGGVFLYSICIK